MASFHFKIKSGKKGSALRHASYITRANTFFSDRETSDLLATGYGNLPEWAAGSPEMFWGASDKNERKNGTTYRELEFALPRELTLEQNIDLVTTLIAERLGDKPYQYAIHCPNAAIDGGRQPHAHVMYSDRLPDGIERSPEQHFRRHNPQCPELGGCRKDGGAASRSALRANVIAERSYFANLQNSRLAEHGHAARVDHRSFADRGLDVLPEKHLGQAGVRGLNQVATEAFIAHRAQSIRLF
ncbi:MAG: plasmid mobilization protein [Proteobacteria bacterium]|nr:MAG: plasmid mobilization protein [Pseudomonadota bacterium]